MLLTAAQPSVTRTVPDENEPTAIEPNSRKSLNDCTLLRSSGRWHWVTMVVAPTKEKFQPTPSSVSPIQKCQSEMPEMEIIALSTIKPSPMPTIRSTPKRAISEPVNSDGTNIPRMCHWMPSAASATE